MVCSSSDPLNVAITLRSSPNTDARSAATTNRSVFSSFTISITWYSTFGFTATAVLATKVQGVVVQTKREAFNSDNLPEVAGNLTKTEGSFIVSYPCASS